MLYYLFLVLTVCAAFGLGIWYREANSRSYSGSFERLKAPLALFDFDGTLCPSYPLFIEQVNQLLGFNLNVEEGEKLKELEVKEMMKTLGCSYFKLPFFLKRARSNVRKKLLDLEPMEGVVAVLKELKLQGYSVGILTSNSEENVRLYCQKHGMDYFDFIYSGNNIFGKASHLSAIIKNAAMSANEIVYVGDEVRDVQAAHKMGVKMIAVSWGYNSKTLLQKSNPQFLVEDFSYLVKLINSSN